MSEKDMNVFGAFCNAQFEEVYRDNMAEARAAGGCDVCVDVGHEPACGQRAWGGEERPRPESPNTVLDDEMWPWVCTRKPGHEDQHVACGLDGHRMHEWGDEDCLRSAPSLMITVSLMMEIVETPMPGKFVRRPDLRLISTPGDITMLPIVSAVPNVNGTWKLKTLTPWDDCHNMVVDCPEHIYKKLPSTRFCEGDMAAKSKIEMLRKGNKLLERMKDHSDMPQDVYDNCMEVAESLSYIHPIENDLVRAFYEHIVHMMQQYEQRHGMAY